MFTRRTLLTTALLLPLVPRVSQATPAFQPATHWLNDTETCLGWWLMGPEKATATQWLDMLSGQVGTFTSMAIPGTSTDGPYQPTTRRGGLADVRLNGTGGHVLIPGTFGNPAAISIAVWVKVDGVDSANGELLTIRDSIILRFQTSGQLRGLHRWASGTYTLSDANDLRGTGWHHVAFVVYPAGAFQALYLDGQQAPGATSANTDAISYTGTGTDTFVGKHVTATTNDLLGAVDDLRVYRRALAAAEVRLLWREGLLGYPTLLQQPTALLAAASVVQQRRTRRSLW